MATGRRKTHLEMQQALAGEPRFHVIRTIPKEHIPKRHGDLENPIIPHKEFDNTAERIQGYRRDEVSHSENWEYGRSINPAESIPKVGRRTQILEHQI